VTEWQIRSGAKGDVPSVLGLWQEAESAPSPTDSEGALNGMLDKDPASLLLATADGQLGRITDRCVGWLARELLRLAVHPDWRRRGIATALVRAGEARLEKLGAVRLTAIVASDEGAAMSLWQSMGYTRQVDRSRFVRMLNSDR
jgi:ribosomal protein S18 acetylase RimI-like enzyme